MSELIEGKDSEGVREISFERINRTLNMKCRFLGIIILVFNFLTNRIKEQTLMKYILCLMVFLTGFLLSCKEEDKLDLLSDHHTYSLFLKASKPHFENETRAFGNQWEDGDCIYIAFTQAKGSYSLGVATYKTADNEWQMIWNGELCEAENMQCQVYFFKGEDFTPVAELPIDLQLSEKIAVFADTSARYSKIGDELFVTANIKPSTWRFYFHGEVGQNVKVFCKTLEYYTSLDSCGFSVGVLSSSSSVIDKVGSSDYFYGRFLFDVNILEVELNEKKYYRLVSYDFLSIGKSGYFKLPSDSNLFGWDEEITSTQINLEGFVADSDEIDLDVMATDQNGSQDITIGDYSNDIDLD